MNGEILLIEDERKIARVIELELSHEGFSVRHAEDGASGLEMALQEEWDLILLDIMLPQKSGIEVLKALREAGSQIPVILLTARNTVSEKVSGFNLGANDYVTKPFSTEELLARIRNLIRLTGSKNNESGGEKRLFVADLAVNPLNREVTRGEKKIELTPREFDLLHYLVQNKDTVLTREQIISDVWGYEFVGDTNLVDVYIRYLRQKIDKGFKPHLIHTQRGVGYWLKDPIS